MYVLFVKKLVISSPEIFHSLLFSDCTVALEMLPLNRKLIGGRKGSFLGERCLFFPFSSISPFSFLTPEE